ncbi:MAG: hypothetical protein A2603_15090 [Bdellovibrionales bacterium RIFOXYD1_FULL_55_31]|nr:MAG: hypothetical protein A2603_15090 [Bdellovibrionales bacterium RIFOXYD1_FULL_55_31]
MTHTESKKDNLSAAIRGLTGENVARCYQCGKCSAGCPMSQEMKLKPHDLMRLASFDQADRIFGDESIWLCLTCETCSARCPNGCDPARVIDTLREMALARDPSRWPRAIGAFHAEFLKQVKNHGRVFELGLILGFKLRTGRLFDDALSGPGVFARGKLALQPHRISGIDEMRKIFEKCENVENRDLS